VIDRVKRALDRRQRGGESDSDVLERLLSETTDIDFDDGFSIPADDDAD